MNKIYNNLNIENLTKTKWFNQFNEKQQKQILLGIENKVNVSIYAKEYFAYNQMWIIKIGLLKKLDVSIYTNKRLNVDQMFQIEKGLEQKLDISWLILLFQSIAL